MRPQKPKSGCRDTALRIITGREHAPAELARKLRDRGFTAEEISDTVTRLEQAGMLSEERFAKAYARELVEERLCGDGEAVMKLCARGVTRSTAESAVEAASHELPEDERAEKLLVRKARVWRGLPPDEARAKAERHLLSHGYAFAIARKSAEAFARMLEDDTDDEKRF